MGGHLQVMRRVLASGRLRRVETAFLGFGAAEYGVWVAVLVYAYGHGGTTMAATIAVVQLIPAAVVAPLAARLVDRRGAAVMLRLSYLLQALALLVTGVVFLVGVDSAVGYGCTAVAASAVTLTRPAQGALLPQIVCTPIELTAANATSGWVEAVSMLLGPAVAGLLMATGGAGVAVLAFGGALLISAALVTGLGVDEWARAGEDAVAASGRSGVCAACAAEPPVVAVLGVSFAGRVAEGASDVLIVVLAIRVLGLGSGGAGYLNAMFGAGAVVGALLAVLLVGPRRLSTPVLRAALAWGLAYGALGAWPSDVTAVLLLAVAGASRTVLGTATSTLLHRSVPPAVHGRIFGAVEGLGMAGLAVGALMVPVLVRLGGVEAAFIFSGGALVAVALGAFALLCRLDGSVAAPDASLGLLRPSLWLETLPTPVLHDSIRTATWSAAVPATAFALDREPILAALGASATARRAPDERIGTRAKRPSGDRTHPTSARSKES